MSQATGGGSTKPLQLSAGPQRNSREEDFLTLNRVFNGRFHVEQLPCWITATTPQTHEIILRNLHRSPLYSGRIREQAPDIAHLSKIRWSDSPRNLNTRVFLEPEGRQTEEFYINGISTSLPYEVQIELVRSIPGLQNAQIMRPGYAVEYDYFPPTQLQSTLESKLISGLYLAGQINGHVGLRRGCGAGA